MVSGVEPLDIPPAFTTKSLCSNSQYLTVIQLFIAPPGIGHLSLKRKGALSIAENGGSLRRSCEFGSDMLWPPPLESEGRSNLGKKSLTFFRVSEDCRIP